MQHVAREADTAHHGGAERINGARSALPFPQHRPDLHLPRRDDARDVRGDERDLIALVRIREGAHGDHAHAQRFDAAAARRTVLDDKPLYRLFELCKPHKALFGDPTPALARRRAVRAVAPDAEAVVIVDLDILKPVLLQEIEHALFEILLHFGKAQIEEAAVFARDDAPVPLQEFALIVKTVAVSARHFKFEPNAGVLARRLDGVRDRRNALGEERAALPPVADGVAPALVVGLVPATVDDEGIDGKGLDRLQNGVDILRRRAAPRRAVFVEKNGHALLGRGHFKPLLLLRDKGVAAGEHAALYRQKSLMRCKAFARCDIFAPMPELIVREPARERARLLLGIHFHLPGRGRFHHRRPNDMPLFVLNGGKGKMPAVGHRPHFAEAFAFDAVARPARI